MMNNKSIKIVQLNMASSKAVSDELLYHCTTRKIDIALVQEPYASRGVLLGLEHSTTRIVKCKTNEHHGIWAAIIVFNNNLDIVSKPQLSTEYTVVLGVAFPGQSPIDLVSSYFQFRKPTEYFTGEITRINEALLDRAVLGLDVNAFSTK